MADTQQSDWSWRLPSLLQSVCSLIILAGVFFMPESPRWLCNKDRHSEALAIFERLVEAVHDRFPGTKIGRSCLNITHPESIDDDAVRAAVAGIRAALPHAALAFERPDGVAFDPHYPNREPWLDRALWSVPVEDTLDTLGQVSKILALDPARIPPPGILVDPPEDIRLAQEQFFAAVRGALAEQTTERGFFNFRGSSTDASSCFSPEVAERLRAVKSAVDPAGVIRSNRPTG